VDQEEGQSLSIAIWWRFCRIVPKDNGATARSDVEGETMKKILIIAASLIVTAPIAYAQSAPNIPQPKIPQRKTLSSEGGRYVFGQVSEYRQDQYMLDTQTGRLWVMAMSPPKNQDGSNSAGGGVLVLQPVQYIDSDGRFGATPR
jgi:hypothetical protein